MYKNKTKAKPQTDLNPILKNQTVLLYPDRPQPRTHHVCVGRRVPAGGYAVYVV